MSNFTFTEDQQNAHDGIIQFLEKGSNVYSLLEGAAGTGKAQPLYSKILTPSGLKNIGEVKIGDSIFSRNGEKTVVTGVFPQGKKKVFNIQFNDGSSVHCCNEHLWQVKNNLSKGSDEKVIDTDEIIKKGVYYTYPKSGKKKYRFSVPTNNTPLDFDVENDFIIHPYILGVLIGDGSLSGERISFTSIDQDIVDRVSTLLSDDVRLSMQVFSDKTPQYFISNTTTRPVNRYLRNIKDLGLDKKSFDKFIPKNYLFSSKDDRVSLLQGLFDTDGSVDKRNGIAYYTSSSLQLVKDIKFLVKSLGGTVGKILERSNPGYYLDKNFHPTRPSYSITISFSNGILPFHLGRKLEHYKVVNSCVTNKTNIVDVSYVGEEECVCISVEHSSKLYMTDECILTHNTTLTTHIVRHTLNNNSLFGKIAIAAPTNKAVKVVKKMFTPEEQEKIDFVSLHSLLGLKHQITSNGKEIFKRDPNSACKLGFYDLIVADEASMIADELFTELDEQNFRGVKVLFVGDGNQINPVNHLHSIPMLPEKRAEHNISHFQLTKVVRQAENNPIIATSQSVLTDQFKYTPGLKNLIDKTGVITLNGDNNILKKLLGLYFCSEKFDENADYCKVLAWTNATVDMFNNIIRKMKYGSNVGKIVNGEKLIVDRPIKYKESKMEVKFTTNEDLVVLNVEEDTRELGGKYYKYYRCQVRGDLITDEIDVIHEDSEAQFKIELNKMADAATKEKDVKKRIKMWRNYYSFMEEFSSVKYNYAITIHNSQGSTYSNAFVIYHDVNRNNRKDEKKRILYTAITRPKELLFIV